MFFKRNSDRDTIQAVREAAIPLARDGEQYDELLAAVGDARFVLIGEASHGTSEFYSIRAAITRRLIEEHGFAAVVVEADWPDAYRVNQYVRGTSDDTDAEHALSGFERFPQWMWRNREVVDFVDWLRRHNTSVRAGRPQCGFYGMDLYSLYTSMEAVLNYLDRVDPDAASRARQRYECFEPFGGDPQAYGYAAGYRGNDCESQAIAQLVDLQRRATELLRRDGRIAEDEHFFAEQNARLVKSAEEYYRQMFAGEKETWNLRDTYMTDTIEALANHLDRHRKHPARFVVWAHNSHLGDARQTEMGDRGEVNVGQLCRERWGRAVFNIGFTTHTGVVAAATHWGDPVEIKSVNPSIEGSVERLLHDVGMERFALVFKDSPAAAERLAERRLERAIGVIYRPATERQSHYFHASVSRQFDAVIHVDTTNAVRPLEKRARFEAQKAETYPTGL